MYNIELRGTSYNVPSALSMYPDLPSTFTRGHAKDVITARTHPLGNEDLTFLDDFFDG